MLVFYAHKFFNICANLNILTNNIKDRPVAERWSQEERRLVIDLLGDIEKQCDAVGLACSVLQIQRVIGMFGVADSETIQHANIVERIHEISVRIQDELSLYLFLQMPSSKLAFYTEPRNQFGVKVLDKFPVVVADVESAGKCFATGNYTASVFHLMRVMECGLRALGGSLNDESLSPDRNPNWETILRKCTDELNKPASKRSDEWRLHEHFYSTATANLRAVKDAWRNPTMHIDQVYDEDQSLAVWNAVKAFMRHLSERLPANNSR